MAPQRAGRSDVGEVAAAAGEETEVFEAPDGDLPTITFASPPLSMRPRPLSSASAKEDPMIDLHYWPTPNGKKVTILLEELGMPYRIVPVNIGRGDQFTPEFLEMNPNHRMPVMVDTAPADGGKPLAVFESGAIMMYLAEKAGQFYPQDLARQGRGQPVGDLADGQPGTQERRVRPLPPRRPEGARRPDLRHHAASPTRSTASTAC